MIADKAYVDVPAASGGNDRSAATGKWGRWGADGQRVIWHWVVGERCDYIDYAWVNAGSGSGRGGEVA
jgi:hypothetical protein